MRKRGRCPVKYYVGRAFVEAWRPYLAVRWGSLSLLPCTFSFLLIGVVLWTYLVFQLSLSLD
jgi:hypothetical protein